MDIIDKLTILFKSKAIKEMTKEDLEVWEGFDKIHPSDIRFPETLEFNQVGDEYYCDRKKSLKLIKQSIINVNKMIYGLMRSKEMSTYRLNYRPIKDSEIKKYLENEKKRLEIHLIELRKLREERKKEMLKQSEGKDGK